VDPLAASALDLVLGAGDGLEQVAQQVAAVDDVLVPVHVISSVSMCPMGAGRGCDVLTIISARPPGQ